MDFIHFHWGWFILACCLIGITRLLFAQIFPFKLLSVTTAATFGFIMFLVIPILSYADVFTISTGEYCIYIWLSYTCFLGGATISRLIFGQNQEPKIKLPPDFRLSQIAVAFCLIYISFSLFGLVQAGGFSRINDVVYGGWAHLETVANIAERYRNYSGFGIIETIRFFGSKVFLCMWFIVYLKMPRRAILIWALYVLSFLGEYFSRSDILGIVLIPFFAFLIINRPSKIRLVLMTVPIVIAALIFFSWNSAARLGRSYQMSLETIVSDTIRDAGNSAAPASFILSHKIRGDPFNYFLVLATFLVPRSVWEDKPLDLYNYDMTYRLTGLEVGQGNSIQTSTILGEAWYYFGWSGVIWLMLLFGFTAFTFEQVLTKNVFGIALYFNVFYLTMIYIRSTFLSYYQAGIMSVISGMVVMGVVRLISNKLSSESM